MAATLWTPSSEAAPRRRNAVRTVALFPFISRDQPNRKIMAAVSGLLIQGAGLMENVKLVYGGTLRRKLRRNPAALVQKCGTDLSCLAALGRKARANEVMLVRAAPEGGSGVKLSFLIIDVKSKDVARKLALVFNTPDDVKPLLGEAFYQIYGITHPGTLEVKGAAGLVLVDGKEVGSGPGPYTVSPGMREVVANGRRQRVMVQPNKKRTVLAADGEPTGAGGSAPVAAQAESEAGEAPLTASPALVELPLEPPPEEGASSLDAVEDPALTALATLPLEDPSISDAPAATELPTDAEEGTETVTASAGEGAPVATVPPPGAGNSRPPPADTGPGVLTWAGVGVAAVGVGLMAGSAALYFPASDTISSLEAERRSGSPATPQVQAMERTNAALADYEISQGLFYGGLVTAVLGAALVAVDLFVLEPNPAVPETRVSVGASSASLLLSWDW